MVLLKKTKHCGTISSKKHGKTKHGQLGVASKVHPLGKDWSSVVTWDGFRSLKDLYQYRIGVEGIQPPQETSKMTEYNPDGFTEMPIYQEIAATKSK